MRRRLTCTLLTAGILGALALPATALDIDRSNEDGQEHVCVVTSPDEKGGQYTGYCVVVWLPTDDPR